MSQVVRLPAAFIERLKPYAQPFETPLTVLNRILDDYEQILGKTKPTVQPAITKKLLSSPDIVFLDGNEDVFKTGFLTQGRAYLKIFYVDGRNEITPWELRGFSASSSAVGNLRSGRLRNWREKGIIRVDLAVDKDDLGDSTADLQEKARGSLHSLLNQIKVEQQNEATKNLLIVNGEGTEEAARFAIQPVVTQCQNDNPSIQISFDVSQNQVIFSANC